MTFPFPIFSPGGSLPGWYAFVYKTVSNQTSLAAVEQPVLFDTVVSDDAGIFEPTSNTLFTIPASWNGRYVIFRASLNVGNATGDSEVYIIQHKNDAIFSGGGRQDGYTAATTTINITSAPFQVSTGDELTLSAYTDDSSFNAGNVTWMSVEVLPSDFRGVLCTKSTGQAIAAATSTIMTFDQEVYDTDNYHDNVTNNSRVTTKSGDSLVILYAGANFGDASSQFIVSCRKNGAGFIGQPSSEAATLGVDAATTQSAVLAVTGGTDYFEADCYHQSATTIAVDNTFFAMRVLPPDTEYALVRRTTDRSGAGEIAWESEVADTGGFWDAGAPTVFTIPEDGWYEISGGAVGVNTTGQFILNFYVDGSVAYPGVVQVDNDTTGAETLSGVTPPLYLTEGQTVSMYVSRTIVADNRSWFCIRKLEPVTE